MRARVRESSLLYYRAIDVHAPVIFMVHLVTRTRQERADIPTEVEDLPAFPVRMAEHLVEVWKLRLACRDEVPRKRAAVGEQLFRLLNESLVVVQGHLFKHPRPRALFRGTHRDAWPNARAPTQVCRRRDSRPAVVA